MLGLFIYCPYSKPSCKIVNCHLHLEMRKQRAREGLEAKPITLLALVLAGNTQHSTAVARTQRVRHTNGEILQRTDFIVLTSSSDLGART